mmetsp:Transcript_3553/g.6685  ORF Transcript_3553/g.6685 Transcript_3553/m.6685 type:complete len:274 (+) Transcript_3553:277-1098(+)|eukprot:CAMPEP_0182502320 /NCGR_PEP_ID=MMETSP1321-20130603/13154_1 /TAXON_ID=91990 /ORGANISM="Bolidomonas sp., Strain RCC1657" /LENGTH=273 /DNA_ID=CAMNT_0024707185 /DNA_START=259 /DNA_END=1080 /DNA_ORIENTATION=-
MTIGEIVLWFLHTSRDVKQYLITLLPYLTPSHISQVSLTYTKLYYTAIKSYLLAINLDKEAVLSLQIGVALGVCILTFLIMYPGEPFDYTKLDGGRGPSVVSSDVTSSSSNVTASVTSKPSSPPKKSRKKSKKPPAVVVAVASTIEEDSQMSLDWPTSKIASKMKKAQKIFGLTDEQLELAIENAKLESRGQKASYNDVNYKAEGDGLSLSQKVDVVVYVGLFLALFYFVRRDFGASAARSFRSYFPREAKALGITADLDEYVYNLKVHENSI